MTKIEFKKNFSANMKTRARDQKKSFWTMFRKVVKITIIHNNSGDQLSLKTATETMLTRSHIIPQGANSTTRDMHASCTTNKP